jgi:hypothetical protein
MSSGPKKDIPLGKLSPSATFSTLSVLSESLGATKEDAGAASCEKTL